MEREIATHKVSGLNDLNNLLTIRAIGSLGLGGANHRYKIDGPKHDWGLGVGPIPIFQCDLKFQQGPIAEAGPTGISNEALLAVVADRLEGFQRGQFACSANEEALRLIMAALDVLHGRTLERAARGVEGTHQA